jgi:hypothetical protein
MKAGDGHRRHGIYSDCKRLWVAFVDDFKPFVKTFEKYEDVFECSRIIFFVNGCISNCRIAC